MRSVIFQPDTTLASYIERYVVHEIPQAYTSYVIPDLSVVMGFQFGGRLSLVNEETKQLDRLCMTGMSGKYRLFQNSADFGIVLVYFTAAGASAFLDVPLHEVFQLSLSIKMLDKRPGPGETEEKISLATSHEERIRIINRFFLRRLKPHNHDLLVAHATNVIRQSCGNIRIKTLSEDLCISQSRLERRFRASVGCSPKKYCTIARLRSVMENVTSVTSLTEVSAQAGYYDQAHFIKDFKSFTGTTPGNYLRQQIL